MATAPKSWDGSPEAALARIDGKLFATTTEAAAILRVDVRVLRHAIIAGEVPGTRVGATYRVAASWLREQAHLKAA